MVQFVRFHSAVPNRRGEYPGVFAMANGLAREGRLSNADSDLVESLNAEAQAAYADPSTVAPECYDRDKNPGARSWFKADAVGLLRLTRQYLDLLDRHSIRWAEVRTTSPGHVVYEDEVQVVAVPYRHLTDWPFPAPSPVRSQGLDVVSLVERPDLAQTCAAWSFGQWGSQTPDGTLEGTIARFQEAADPQKDFRHTYVALVGGAPAAMASLSPTDLDSRPDLAPWLASVYTHPDQRGRGLATQLCEAIAAHARDLGHAELYLYTPGAEALYAQLGWQTIDTVDSPHGASHLMRLTLAPQTTTRG